MLINRAHVSPRDRWITCLFFTLWRFLKQRNYYKISRGVAFRSFQMQKGMIPQGRLGITALTKRDSTCFAFAKFALIEHVASLWEEGEKEINESYLWSRHGPTACLYLSKINGMDVGVFSKRNRPKKYSGSSVFQEKQAKEIFWFKRHTRRDTRQETQNIKGGTIPSMNVIKISLFGCDPVS